MQIKDYQQRSLNRLSEYLDAFNLHQVRKHEYEERMRGFDGARPYDALLEAWKQITGNQRYLPYQNALNEDIPHVCIKIPTGGGKTYLATRSIELIQRKFHGEQTGLVLWIVPNKAIYSQTLRDLRNKHHPYRQTLDKSSSGKTLVLEKDDFFSQADVRENIVVLLLMLQSGNRKLRDEQLKLFKGRGGFMSFFPPEGHLSQHKELWDSIPNLDIEGGKDELFGPSIRPSLGNVIRLLQPLIILDESHRASSDLAHETLRDFNPSFVLEFSATPKEDSNILVNVTGQELHQEEMIKLDLHVSSKDSVEWEAALMAGHQQILELEQVAREYRANGGVYIRPIALISVERTGANQDTGEHIHVNDVRRRLIQYGISPEQIAVKSSEVDELKNVDLLSENCPIQYILTKDALKEGWDCSFAYVLVILQSTKSKVSLTQLIGRILRQPYARKTGIKALDESYLFCYHSSPKDIVEAISKGFREEGLDDLNQRVLMETRSKNAQAISIPYRDAFKEWTIYLPRFVIQEKEGFRPLSYLMDILPYVEWGRLSFEDFSLNLSYQRPEDSRLSLTLGDNAFNPLKSYGYQNEGVQSNVIDPFYFMRQIADIVPNDWQARRIVDTLIAKLKKSYAPEEIANHPALIAEEMRRFLKMQVEGYFGDEVDSIGLAGEAFLERIRRGEIIFFLEKTMDYTLPKFIRGYEGEKREIRNDNRPIQRSLFDPIPKDSHALNELERSVALYLDEQHNLLWWYKHLVGEKYALQGWRNSRIYPDFVAAHRNDAQNFNTVYVLETKGLHISQSDDTRYKHTIFDLCNELGEQIRWEDLGTEFKYKQVQFHVIFDTEWKQKINQLFN